MEQTIKIHKRNQLSDKKEKLSVPATRALNAIYHFVKENIKEESIEELEDIAIDFSYLREMMRLENTDSYIQEIQKALTELLETTLELNNFRNPKDGKLLEWYSIPFFLSAYTEFDEEEEKRIAHITLPPLMKHLMFYSKDESFMESGLIPTLNKLRTKYAMKLYEFFKKFEDYKYIDLPQDFLLKILGIEDKKDYKYYSHLERLLSTQIKELNKKTEFENLKMVEPTKQMKKDKYFKFIINPQSKKVLQDMEEIEKITKN